MNDHTSRTSLRISIVSATIVYVWCDCHGLRCHQKSDNASHLVVVAVQSKKDTYKEDKEDYYEVRALLCLYR